DRVYRGVEVLALPPHQRAGGDGPAVARDRPGRGGGFDERLGIDLVGVGEAGLLATDRTDAHALLDGVGTIAHDAVLHRPALPSRMLEIQVAEVDAGTEQAAKGAFQAGGIEPGGLQETGLGKLQREGHQVVLQGNTRRYAGARARFNRSLLAGRPGRAAVVATYHFDLGVRPGPGDVVGPGADLPHGLVQHRVRRRADRRAHRPAGERAGDGQQVAGTRQHLDGLVIALRAQVRGAADADVGCRAIDVQVVGARDSVAEPDRPARLVEGQAAIEEVTEVQGQPARQFG